MRFRTTPVNYEKVVFLTKKFLSSVSVVEKFKKIVHDQTTREASGTGLVSSVTLSFSERREYAEKRTFETGVPGDTRRPYAEVC